MVISFGKQIPREMPPAISKTFLNSLIDNSNIHKASKYIKTSHYYFTSALLVGI